MKESKESSNDRRQRILKKRFKQAAKITSKIYGYAKEVAEVYGLWELLSQLLGL